MKQSLIAVRPATVDDAEAIVDVQYKTWLATYPAVAEGVTYEMVRNRFENDQFPLADRIELCRERIAKPEHNRRQFVHETASDKVNGFIIAGDQPGGRKEILALYVLPDSQSQGVGSQLMQAALEYLDAQHNETALCVVSTNSKSISFYEKHGFSKTRDMPAEEDVSDKGGFYMPHIEMVRPPAPL